MSLSAAVWPPFSSCRLPAVTRSDRPQVPIKPRGRLQTRQSESTKKRMPKRPVYPGIPPSHQATVFDAPQPIEPIW